MSKIITSTGWYGVPGKEHRRTKVHMVAKDRPVCGANPVGEYQWCSNGANYQYTDCVLCRQYYDKHESNESRIVVNLQHLNVNLRGCARCHGNHDKLIFEKLDNPHFKYTHWAPCPTNHQPILLKTI